MGNSNLHKSKRAKNDEFYTQYETIEDELKHYKEHFEGKTVYCNCDDPRWSNFFRYFVDNFHELKLKRIIASGYVDQSYNLFTIYDKREPAIWADYDGWLVDGRVPDVSEIEVKELKGDGDFRSDESIELLKQADIVVTNPPFSLFREFVPMLMKYDKDFLAIATINAITYKPIFPLIKDSKMWPGSNNNGSMEFLVPPHTEFRSKDAGRIDEDGIKYLSLSNVCWWTNLEHNFKNEYIELVSTYKDNKDKYPKYDNYDAINVDKVADIPKDYKGVMGVPISFIFRWNPEQFEILNYPDGKISPGQWIPYINGQTLYARILIQGKRLNPEIYGG